MVSSNFFRILKIPSDFFKFLKILGKPSGTAPPPRIHPWPPKFRFALVFGNADRTREAGLLPGFLRRRALRAVERAWAQSLAGKNANGRPSGGNECKIAESYGFLGGKLVPKRGGGTPSVKGSEKCIFSTFCTFWSFWGRSRNHSFPPKESAREVSWALR